MAEKIRGASFIDEDGRAFSKLKGYGTDPTGGAMQVALSFGQRRPHLTRNGPLTHIAVEHPSGFTADYVFLGFSPDKDDTEIGTFQTVS